MIVLFASVPLYPIFARRMMAADKPEPTDGA
jgi:hypothetical protein